MVSFFNADIGKIRRKDVRNFLCGQVLNNGFSKVVGKLKRSISAEKKIMKCLIVIWECFFCNTGIQRKIRMRSGITSGNDKVWYSVICALLLTFCHFVKIHVVAAEIPLFGDNIGCQIESTVEKAVVQQ